MGEEEIESSFLRELFYIQRLYGNPDVKIEQRIWEEFQKISISDRYGFTKTGMEPSNRWNEEGPWNISGRIRGLATDPSNPDVIYAASASGGVWKTTNMGFDWFPLTDEMPNLALGAITIDQSNPNRIFAGIGEPDIYSTGRGNYTPIFSRSIGLLRSEDAGQNWTLIPWSSGNMGGVHRIALHPQSADTIIIATTTDLWKTTNGGQTWFKPLSGIMTDVIYKPGQPLKVYAAFGDDNGNSSNGVYTSDQGGNRFSWRRLSNNFPTGDSCGRIVLAISPANPNRLYAAVALSRSLLQVPESDFLLMMVSADGGETWERKINAISTTFTNGQAYFDLAIGVSPTDPNFVLLGGLDVYRSTNGGNSFFKVSEWTKAPTDPKYVHADIHFFTFKLNDPNTVIVGSDGGVSVSSDRAITWTLRSSKLGTVQYYSCAFDPSNPTSIFGGTQDNGTHGKMIADNSKWSEIWGGDGGNVVIDPASSSIRYVTTTSVQSGQVLRPIIRLINNSPTMLNKGLSQDDRFNWVPPLAMHPTDPTRLFFATQYLYVMRNPSSGSSPSWQVISPDLAPPYGIVTDFAIPLTQGEWIYTISNIGRAHICKNTQSLDPIWEEISQDLPNRWLSDITVDWDDYQTAYVAVSGFGAGHAYKTTNAGKNWIDISGDLPDIPAGAIVRSRDDAHTIFLATDIGIWITTNGGKNWKKFGIGLPNVVAYDMKLAPNNTLVVGTHGRGMWTTSAILSADRVASEYPQTITLSQNYPNPFNPLTNIKFSLPVRSRTVVRIYDLSGNEIRTLLDDIRDAGDHTVILTADNLPSGLYLYTLETRNQKLTKKLMILK